MQANTPEMHDSTSEIRRYSLTGDESKDVLDHALRILKRHLPVSIPLYRRLQFGRFFDASVLLTNVPTGAEPLTDSPWLFAFVDRSCRPETEALLFCSWEVQSSDTTPSESGSQHATEDLLKSLIRAMRDLGTPLSIHQDLLDAKAEELQIEKDLGGFSRDEYGAHMIDPNIMLWGATHEKTVPILQHLGFLTLRFKAGVVPNFTFIWDVDGLPTPRELPEGLRWGELEPRHFALVRSRTQIPRQDRTLAILPNLGIFAADSDAPIGWAFIGLDASLTSLHVEPVWRGKGLAKAITTKLFRQKMDRFRGDGKKHLAHGYVINGNKESEGMCRSLGGTSDWEVYWLRVDLSQLEKGYALSNGVNGVNTVE